MADWGIYAHCNPRDFVINGMCVLENR